MASGKQPSDVLCQAKQSYMTSQAVKAADEVCRPWHAWHCSLFIMTNAGTSEHAAVHKHQLVRDAVQVSNASVDFS